MNLKVFTPRINGDITLYNFPTNYLFSIVKFYSPKPNLGVIGANRKIL